MGISAVLVTFLLLEAVACKHESYREEMHVKRESPVHHGKTPNVLTEYKNALRFGPFEFRRMCYSLFKNLRVMDHHIRQCIRRLISMQSMTLREFYVRQQHYPLLFVPLQPRFIYHLNIFDCLVHFKYGTLTQVISIRNGKPSNLDIRNGSAFRRVSPTQVLQAIISIHGKHSHHKNPARKRKFCYPLLGISSKIPMFFAARKRLHIFDMYDKVDSASQQPSLRSKLELHQNDSHYHYPSRTNPSLMLFKPETGINDVSPKHVCSDCYALNYKLREQKKRKRSQSENKTSSMRQPAKAYFYFLNRRKLLQHRPETQARFEESIDRLSRMNLISNTDNPVTEANHGTSKDFSTLPIIRGNIENKIPYLRSRLKSEQKSFANAASQSVTKLPLVKRSSNDEGLSIQEQNSLVSVSIFLAFGLVGAIVLVSLPLVWHVVGQKERKPGNSRKSRIFKRHGSLSVVECNPEHVRSRFLPETPAQNKIKKCNSEISKKKHKRDPTVHSIKYEPEEFNTSEALHNLSSTSSQDSARIKGLTAAKSDMLRKYLTEIEETSSNINILPTPSDCSPSSCSYTS